MQIDLLGLEHFQDNSLLFELAGAKCGCYSQNKVMPLKHIDYEVEIINALASVTLTQKYENPTDKYLELQYSFPVNPDACVYRFIATFHNTKIQGIVKEKQTAQKEYKKAVQAGKQAAYGEIDKNSKDILNLLIGNVPPKTEVKIQIKYLEQLVADYNTFYKFRMPSTLSPRYANQINQESFLKSFQKIAKTNMGGDFYWNFRISLKTTRKLTFFSSATHPLKLIKQNSNHTETQITFQEKCLPNKDFNLYFSTEDFELPNFAFGRTDNSSAAMISFIPKFCTLSADDAFVASKGGTPYEADIDTAVGEYIFLLDRSGSMGGSRIQKAKQALILFLKSLPENTYFNVVSFGNSSQKLFQKSYKYSNETVANAVASVSLMSADMGGTQIQQPLRNLLTQEVIKGYPKQIFLLTDGEVSNTEQVIQMVGKNTKYSRVHSIGIGNGASVALIKGCAQKGKGYHIFIDDGEAPAAKIIQLLTDSLSPVISEVEFDFDREIVESVIPNPASIPYILKNQVVNFFVTFKGQLQKSASFKLSYKDSHNKNPYSSTVIIDPSAPSQGFVDKMCQFKRIRLLEESQKNNGNYLQSMYFVKTLNLKNKIIEESVKNQILSCHTAFLCVGKELVDGQYQEIKSVGKMQAFIQPMAPIDQSKMMNCRNPSATSTTTNAHTFNNLFGFSSSQSALSQPQIPFQMNNNSIQIGGFSPFGQLPPPPPLPSHFSNSPPPPPLFSIPPPPPPTMSCTIPPPPPTMISQSLPPLPPPPASQQKSAFNKLLDFQFEAAPSINNTSNPFDLCDFEENEISPQMEQLEFDSFDFASIPADNSSVQNQNIQNFDFAGKDINLNAFSFDSFNKPSQVSKPDPKKQLTIAIKTIKTSQDILKQLISRQNIDGSWDFSLELFSLFEHSKQIEKLILQEQNKKGAFTILIVCWMQKYFAQKQYTLIIKKALNWTKKASLNFEKYSKIYQAQI